MAKEDVTGKRRAETDGGSTFAAAYLSSLFARIRLGRAISNVNWCAGDRQSFVTDTATTIESPPPKPSKTFRTVSLPSSTRKLA